MFKIMIVEDDQTIATLLAEHLRRWGYEAHCCVHFEDVLGEFVRLSPHLVLMDISLPFFNGYHWCGKLRQVSTVPILFLSSHGASMDQVMAMSMGGDDYITKPFDLEVALAKIGALLRRAYDFTGSQSLLEHRGAVLDIGASALLYGDARLELTKNENRILQLLLERKGATVSRDALMHRLWDSDCFVDDNTLTVNVTRLRKKLEDIGLTDFILTQRGEGYRVDLA